MKTKIAEGKIGGSYMVESVDCSTIFSREQFTQQQKDIQKMVVDFCIKEVFPHKEKIEAKNFHIIKELLKKMGGSGPKALGVIG